MLNKNLRYGPRFGAFTALCGAATAALFALLAGCGGGGGGTDNPTPGASPTPPAGNVERSQPGWTKRNPAYVQPQKKWTFLVYMNGANDLEEYGLLNMNQMEQIGSDENINMVVQFKRYKGRYDSSDGDWGSTRRYYVGKDNNTASVTSALLSERDDLDMGKAQSLQDFIQWGIQTYPAERFCLVLWNHGAGWRSVKTPTRGFSYDDTTDSHIDTIEFPAAIDRGDGRKWDIVAWDSSLMQMLEVAYEIRDKATYIVGSEESPPGEGFRYDKFLAPLKENPDKSTLDFADSIAKETANFYNTRDGSDSNSTQSVLDASKIAAIVPPINDLGQALLNAKGAYGDRIAYARDNSENYDYPQNSDIKDFMRLLSQPIAGTTTIPVPVTEVQNAVTRVNDAVSAAVLKNYNSPRHPRSNGLAIFLPTPLSYSRIDIEQANGFGQRYSLLSFAKAAPNWQSFLINGPN